MKRFAKIFPLEIFRQKSRPVSRLWNRKVFNLNNKNLKYIFYIFR